MNARLVSFCITMVCAAAPIASADPVNLALNRPTQTSSTSQWSHPDDGHGAVDGVINGSFGFHTDPNDPGAWWQVDLGASVGISEVIVYNRLDCCAERSVTLYAQLSDDGANWREVFSNPGTVFGGNDGNPLHIPVNASARFVRLQLRPPSPTPLHLDEVQVMGVSPTNVALNKPTQTSSTSQWSHPDDGHGAVDGVINGSFGFHTDPNDPGAWWQVDLGDEYGVSEIVVFNRLDCCAERSISLFAQLSDDGANWREVFSNPGTVFGGNDGNPLHIPVNAATRFVRLQLRPPSPTPLHLDEVQVMSTGPVAAPAQAYATPAVYSDPPPVAYDPPPATYTPPPPPEPYYPPPPPPSPVGYWDAHPVPGGGWCPYGGPHLHDYEPEFMDQYVLEDGYLRFGWGYTSWTYYGQHPIPGGGWCGIGAVHSHPYRPEAGFRNDSRRGGYVYDREHAQVVRDRQPQRPPPNYRPPPTVAQHAAAHPPPPTAGFKRPPPQAARPPPPNATHPGNVATSRPGMPEPARPAPQPARIESARPSMPEPARPVAHPEPPHPAPPPPPPPQARPAPAPPKPPPAPAKPPPPKKDEKPKKEEEKEKK